MASIPCAPRNLKISSIKKVTNMLGIKVKHFNCFLCNVKLGSTSRSGIDIFGENTLAKSVYPIVNVLNSTLDQSINKENARSSIICKKCHKLVDEADELNVKLKEAKLKICSVFKKTTEKLSETILNNEEVNIDHDYIENIDTTVPNVKTRQAAVFKKKGKKKTKDTTEDLKSTEINTSKTDEKVNEPIVEESLHIDKEIIESELMDADDTDLINGENINEDSDSDERNNDDDYNEDDDDDDDDDENGFVSDSQIEEVLVDEKSASKLRKTSKKEDPEEFAIKVEDDYKCSICKNDEVYDSKTIITHLKNEHNSKLYICDVCGDMFRKRTELSRHLDEHVAKENGDFQCEVCNRIFNNLRLFRIHKRIHYPQIKSWSCDACGKKYNSKNLLDEHMNTHTGKRPYVCDVCNKDFASKYTFRAHVKTHESRPRPFKCTQCTKSFLTQQNLTQHVKTHTGIKDFVCTTCGKGFGSAHNLEVHNIVHTGYKPYICRTCGKAFARKAEIRDHERTHTGEKPYQCETCGATFSQRSNLQSHKRATHLQDKRYKCDDCGKGFKRRRLLDYHIKAAHTGERPYKCPTCSSTFVYPEHFKKHMRIHTGEKPYVCEVCGKAFNSRDNRNAHRFIHSDKKPYECIVCGTGFMRKPLLYAHMQQENHNNDTIVVNQPRLTAEDQVVLQDVSPQQPRFHVIMQGSDNQLDENTQLILAQLKNNQVLIQDGNQHKILSLAGTNINGDEVNEIVLNEQMTFEESEEVHFKQEEEDNEENEVSNFYGYQDEEGRMILLPRGTDIKELLAQEHKGLQLLRISLPTGTDVESRDWLNLVQSS